MYENSREMFGKTRTRGHESFPSGTGRALQPRTTPVAAGSRPDDDASDTSVYPRNVVTSWYTRLCIGMCRSGAEDRGGGGGGGGGRRESAALPRAENNNKKEKKNGNYNYDFVCVRGLPIGPCAWCPWRGQRIENRI